MFLESIFDVLSDSTINYSVKGHLKLLEVNQRSIRGQMKSVKNHLMLYIDGKVFQCTT